MSTYQQLVTLAGRAADVASRLPGGEPLDFFNGHVIFGDANGATLAPVETMTGLVHQVETMAVSNVTQDPGDATRFIVECTYGDTESHTAARGYTIREIGVKLADGTLFSLGAAPATYLPSPSEGSARSFVVRIPFILASGTPNVTIGDNVSLYATEQWVFDNVMGVTGALAGADAALALVVWQLLLRVTSLEDDRVRNQREIAWLRARMDKAIALTPAIGTP